MTIGSKTQKASKVGQNPITDDTELEWIRKKVKEVHASLDAALKEARDIDSNKKRSHIGILLAGYVTSIV